MRAESVGARTWLFGGVALWALATWAIALAGLGSRIERLPPDPALVQRLPTAAAGAEDRLGPLAQYAEFGERPLFTSDRRPQPFVINPEDEDAPAEFEYVLTSVLMTPGLEVAIVQPADGGESVRLKVGESPAGAQGWQLASISPRGAVFDGPQGQRALELRVFDGTGGEAPTPMSAPPPQAASASRPGGAAAQSGAPGRSRAAATPVAGEAQRPEPAPAATPQPASTEGEAQPSAPASPTETPTARSSEEQVEAIRARIEARRARMREQAQQGR